MNEGVLWRTWSPLWADGQTIYSDDTKTTALLTLPEPLANTLVDSLQAGTTEDALTDVIAPAGMLPLAQWLEVFDAMCRVGRVLPLLPDAPGSWQVLFGRPSAPGISTSEPLKLSRHTVITPDESGALLIEEPVASLRIRTSADALAEILAAASTPGDHRQRPSTPRGWIPAAISIAANYGLLVRCDDPQESWWQPHDRYFHWRTRRDQHGHVSGATYPHRDRRPALPVSEQLSTGSRVSVPRASWSQESALAQLLARRSTVRDCPEPLTWPDLQAFLAAHAVIEVVPGHDDAGNSYPQSRRLYPGGGATYELEVCLTTCGVNGVADAIWWYDAESSELVALNESPAAVRSIIDDALVSSGGVGTPRAVVTYALRMGRNSWKYEGMAYRLALLDAGVLYHHAYLLATELGLGVCGLGNGNSELFGRLTGHNSEELASVAELMLTGRQPA